MAIIKPARKSIPRGIDARPLAAACGSLSIHRQRSGPSYWSRGESERDLKTRPPIGAPWSDACLRDGPIAPAGRSAPEEAASRAVVAADEIIYVGLMACLFSTPRIQAVYRRLKHGRERLAGAVFNPNRNPGMLLNRLGFRCNSAPREAIRLLTISG